MEYVMTRREAIWGGSCLIATTGIVSPAQALALPVPVWTGAIAVGLASNAAYDLIKNNWGLQDWLDSPSTKIGSPSSVQAPHAEAVKPLRKEGYEVKPTLSGPYSGGSIEISQAVRGEDLELLTTTDHSATNHSVNVCSNRFDKADIMGLSLVAKALCDQGVSPADVQALTLPLHPPGAHRYVGNRRLSPTYMTPSNGTINWSTNFRSTRPNIATTIRSGPVDTTFRFAQRDNGSWVFNMKTG